MTNGFFASLFQSFHNPNIYLQAVMAWPNMAFRFWLRLAIFNVLVMMLSLVTYIGFLRHDFLYNQSSEARAIFEHVITELPDMTVRAGKLKIDQKLPYVINWPNSNDPMIRFVENIPSGYAEADDSVVLILGRDKFVSPYYNKSSSEYNYNMFEAGKYDGKSIKDVIFSYLEFRNINSPQIFMIVLLNLILIYLPITTALEMVVLGVIAMLLSIAGRVMIRGLARPMLDFKALFRLSILAMSPAAVLSLGSTFVVLLFSGKLYFLPWWVTGFCNLGFLYFGLTCLARSRST